MNNNFTKRILYDDTFPSHTKVKFAINVVYNSLLSSPVLSSFLLFSYRFLAICYPMQWQITSRGCRCIITTIWIFSFSITIPWAVYFRLISIGKTSENEMLYVCREVWPTERLGTIYFLIANLVICYLLPLSVIFLCYVFIWLKVWKRKMPGEGEYNNGMVHRSKVKVIKMLFLVVLAFMFSWLPLYAIFTRIKVGEPYLENSSEELIIQISAPIAQWLGASNSCINPILYAFFNKKFRAGFRTVLFYNKACCKASSANARVMSRTKTVATSGKVKIATSLRKCSCETHAL